MDRSRLQANDVPLSDMRLGSGAGLSSVSAKPSLEDCGPSKLAKRPAKELSWAHLSIILQSGYSPTSREILFNRSV